jgi:hypothetical protein
LCREISRRRFADVVARFQVLSLPRQFGDSLNDYVRPKFTELWDDLRQHSDRDNT